MKTRRRLPVLQDRATRFPKSETFVAFISGRSSESKTDPASSIPAAMERAKDACASGKSVVVRGQYTSDGTKHRGNRGRLVAWCENGKWRR